MNWLKKVLTSGLALAIPLGVIIYVLIKILALLEHVLAPLSKRMGFEHILGELTLTIIATFVLTVFVLFLGILMQLSFMHTFQLAIENTALWIFPSLARIKAMAAEKVSLESAANTWKPVLIMTENQFYPAFIVEESETTLILNIMLSNSPSDCELMIVQRHQVKYIQISTDQMLRCLRNFGKGFASIIDGAEALR